MRRLLDSLLSRWYVPREVHYNYVLAAIDERIRRQRGEAQEFYVDSEGNYWPVAPTLTRGTPCH